MSPFARIPLVFSALALASCSSMPSLPALPDMPGDGARGPFVPRDVYPTPPNVGRLIGPEDCRGSTLAAVTAGLPEYPARAFVNGRQGWVIVRFNVERTGEVDDVRIARSVPDGVFDRAARRAVRGWQFRPLESANMLENCVVMFEFRAGEVRVR